MAEKKYTLNKETGKIELYFSRQEYFSLSEASKKELKANFLFSGRSGAWVSRSKHNHCMAINIAEKLGFTDGGITGERLTYVEELTKKAERAEARAERFEKYADNASRRGTELQAEFNRLRQDWAWITQPIITGHAGSQAFGRQRERVLARYDKGFEEYRKSDYFRQRATAAQKTANMTQLQDPVYLTNRIKECKKNIKTYSKRIAEYENEHDNNLHGHTQEQIEEWLKECLEKLEYEINKQAFLTNALDELGVIIYTQKNIKPGYIVKIRGLQCQIIKANLKTVETRCLITGMVLNYDYSEIQEIIKAGEIKPKQETEKHPYKVGEILVNYNASGNAIINAYKILSATEKTIQIRQLQLDRDRKPLNEFKLNSKPQRKKPTVNSYSNKWQVTDDNGWNLYKYVQ